MCRFAAWRGPDRPLSALLYDPPHSLSQQAWAPREMLFGNVNVDGTGVAWWPSDTSSGGRRTDEQPLRYVTPAAAWNDANLPALAPRLASPLILAAVRSATPGIPFGPANVAPFTVGGLALAHNGFIQDFREGVGRGLLAGLSDRSFGAMNTISDSLTILLLVADLVDAGAPLAQAVEGAIAAVTEAVANAGVGATLNLLASDGHVLVATRASVGLGHNSLYLRRDHGVTIASEPLDDEAGWDPVPIQSIVVADDTGCIVRPL